MEIALLDRPFSNVMPLCMAAVMPNTQAPWIWDWTRSGLATKPQSMATWTSGTRTDPSLPTLAWTTAAT